MGRRVPRLYCLTPLPRRRTNSQSPTHTPGTSCHCHAFIRVCGRLCRLVPRRLLRLGISAPAPTRTPPRGARPHDTHSLAPHPRTRGPTHPHTHAFITFHALLHLLGMPPPPHRPITRWKQIGSVDGTETKSTSITCVAPAPGPTERPGRVTTYNRPALGPHAQRQPTLRTIDNNALAAPRRPVEHQPASRAAPGNAPGRPPPCAPYACAWRLWPPDHTSASL